MISEGVGAVLSVKVSAVSVVWRKYITAGLVGTSKTSVSVVKGNPVQLTPMINTAPNIAPW